MSARVEVLNQIGAYLDGRQSLASFQGWFMPFFWDLDVSGDQEILQLSRRVAGKLAEHGRDDLSEERLQSELANAVHPTP
jgi:hypothetical protein